MKQSEENGNKIRVGSVVEGKVIAVKPEEIIVDIQYKADGIVTRNEYSSTPNLDLTTVVKVGDPSRLRLLRQTTARDRFSSHTRELLQMSLMTS